MRGSLHAQKPLLDMRSLLASLGRRRLETTGGKEQSFPTSLEKEKENEKLRLSLTAMIVTSSYDDHHQL
ncbi:hypothetical protein U0070_017681, partial [Myodes glareolus]